MLQHIRNIAIIAHIDHGKTTLTDRLMLRAGTISQREFHDQLLDSNPIERERGITIKLAPVRIDYQLPQNLQPTLNLELCTLNLIDTPGHVDFGYEVERSLAACEGAVLLIDATQGVQAQTLSNFDKAQKLGLRIIVALNKIDLPAADPEAVTRDITQNLGISPEDIIQISAKTGHNIDTLFEAIITKIPPPQAKPSQPLQALVFNSLFHPHLGAIAFVKVTSGSISSRDQLLLMANSYTFTPKEIGFFAPTMKSETTITSGNVGYLATGLKDVRHIKVGDTVTHAATPAQKPLPGYKEPLPMVYMDLYPVDGKDFTLLKDAIDKLALNDAALRFSPVSSLSLGKGFRVGFLGALHAEIVLERLNREYNLDLVPTAPTVVYQVTTTAGDNFEVNNPSDLPDPSQIQEIKEPIASVTIFTPDSYLGGIMQLVSDSRGELLGQTYIGSRVKLEYIIPLAELIVNFFDQLKSVSQGYASLEYSLFDYQSADIIKLSILINKEPVEALSQLVIKSKVLILGKRMVVKLKDAIPRQLFDIAIQAAVGGDIIARETVKAYRKDVTAKLYGGDITRRKKLLEKQKKGKKLRGQHFKVDIPQSAYLAVLKQ